jgi:hypothetical protein
VPVTFLPPHVPVADAAIVVSWPVRKEISPCVGAAVIVISGAGSGWQAASHPAKTKTRAGRPTTTGAVRVAASSVGEASAGAGLAASGGSVVSLGDGPLHAAVTEASIGMRTWMAGRVLSILWVNLEAPCGQDAAGSILVTGHCHEGAFRTTVACVANTGAFMPLTSETPPSKGMPKLLRYLGLHMMTGFAIGVIVASAMIFANLAGLKDLLVEAQEPFVAMFLLYAFNALTFGSVSMGVAVMTMPYDGPCDMRDPDDAEGRGPRR